MPLAVNGFKVCSSPNCIYQGQPQSIDAFNNQSYRKDGKEPQCRDCKKALCQRYKNSGKARQVRNAYRETPKSIESRKRYAESEPVKEHERQRAIINRRDPKKAPKILARNRLNRALPA